MKASVDVALDDLLVYSKDEKEHLQHLEALFTAASAANLQISTTKSELFKKKAKFLGHVLELQDGVVHIRAQEDKLKAIREWPRPRCTKELQAFLGLANYYHRLIRDFANLATPLLELGPLRSRDIFFDKYLPFKKRPIPIFLCSPACAVGTPQKSVARAWQLVVCSLSEPTQRLGASEVARRLSPRV
jgi:hypothetical protein